MEALEKAAGYSIALVLFILLLKGQNYLASKFKPKEKDQKIMPEDRGILINREAYLGSQIVQLKEQIPEVEKQARKTPPKHLKAEIEKVLLAKKQLPILQIRLKEHQTEQAALKIKLTAMGHYG